MEWLPFKMPITSSGSRGCELLEAKDFCLSASPQSTVPRRPMAWASFLTAAHSVESRSAETVWTDAFPSGKQRFPARCTGLCALRQLPRQRDNPTCSPSSVFYLSHVCQLLKNKKHVHWIQYINNVTYHIQIISKCLLNKKHFPMPTITLQLVPDLSSPTRTRCSNLS